MKSRILKDMAEWRKLFDPDRPSIPNDLANIPVVTDIGWWLRPRFDGVPYAYSYAIGAAANSAMAFVTLPNTARNRLVIERVVFSTDTAQNIRLVLTKLGFQNGMAVVDLSAVLTARPISLLDFRLPDTDPVSQFYTGVHAATIHPVLGERGVILLPNVPADTFQSFDVGAVMEPGATFGVHCDTAGTSLNVTIFGREYSRDYEADAQG